MVADPMVMPLARELLACLEQEIIKVEFPPRYVQLRTGAVVDHLISETEDECCDGLAWVRPVTFFPSSDTFPVQDDTPTPKGITGWAVQLEIGAIRCAPTPPPSRIPTESEWNLLTQAVMDDAAAFRRAVCCFGELAYGRLKVMTAQPWLPISLEGGCTGGVMSITVRAPACDCSEAGPAS